MHGELTFSFFSKTATGLDEKNCHLSVSPLASDVFEGDLDNLNVIGLTLLSEWEGIWLPGILPGLVRQSAQVGSSLPFIPFHSHLS
jgi:hypothetical protein